MVIFIIISEVLQTRGNFFVVVNSRISKIALNLRNSFSLGFRDEEKGIQDENYQ